MAKAGDRDQRQDAIRELVVRNEIHSQDEMGALLATEGITVTQATLSRDLREMGVRKQGGLYRLPELPKEAIRRRRRVFRELAGMVQTVSRGGTIVVLRARVGQAPALALAVYQGEFVEVIGAVADVNTVLVACGTAAQARSFARGVDEAIVLRGL